MTDHDPHQDDPTQIVPMTPAVPAAPAAPAVPVDAGIAAPLTPVTMQPVSTTAGTPRSSRGRWAIALGAAALVIAIATGVVLAMVGRAPDATVLGYVPKGAVMYGEVRLDLPGDQRRQMGEFLSHFPGFADQSALDSKLDEVLDQLVADASGDKQTYTKDIKPWFGGELAFSAGPLPDPKDIMSGSNGTGPGIGNALALLSVKDAAAAQAWFDAAFAQAGATTTTETYGGTTLTVFGSAGGPQAALAIADGKVAIAGEISSVKAAIDTKGAGGFAEDPDVKAALAADSSDHLGFVYLALKPILDWSMSLQDVLGDQTGGAAKVAPMSESMLKMLPDWGAYWVRVEGDAVVMEAVAPKPATTLGPTKDRASDVAKHVPSTALALAVSHDTGATLQQTLDLYKGEASLKDVTDALEKGLGVLGGADSAVGWIGDTGLVVNGTGDTVEGGLVILPTDAKAAGSFFTSIKNLASISGAAGVTFRDEDHDGVTITIASVDPNHMTGGSSDLPGVVPFPTDKVEIAWAVTDDVVVIGSGPGFVKHVLDTTDATSLASNDRYESLMHRVGDGTNSLFVDIAGVRTLAEGALKDADAAARKTYETDIKPFLTPLDALVASGSVSGDLTHSKVIITVK